MLRNASCAMLMPSMQYREHSPGPIRYGLGIGLSQEFLDTQGHDRATYSISFAPIWICGWRTGKWLCTDHRASLCSTVELGFKIRVNKLAELGAVLHVVGPVPPRSPELGERWPFFAVRLKLDKVHKITGNGVIRNELVAKDGLFIVL